MNKVILLGRLTKDVDVKYTQTTNIMISSFSLAVNRRFIKQISFPEFQGSLSYE